MKYLLDTNHWIDIQEGHPAVIERLRRLPEGTQIYMPVVAQGELLVGVLREPDSQRREGLRSQYKRHRALCDGIPPVTSAVAERYAGIVSQLGAGWRSVRANDIWIAAIAMVNDLTLVTSDKHFGGIEGLRLEDWRADVRESS